MTLQSPLAAARITSSIAPTIRSGVWREMEVFARRDRQMTGNLRLAGYQRGICGISDSISPSTVMRQPYSPVKRNRKTGAGIRCNSTIPTTRPGTDSLSLTRELTPGPRLYSTSDPIMSLDSGYMLFAVRGTRVQQEPTSDSTHSNFSWK